MKHDKYGSVSLASSNGSYIVDYNRLNGRSLPANPQLFNWIGKE